MATVTYIPEETQSKTAMGKVMRYCARQDKTAYELDGKQIQLISGKDCVAETAYQEFMATKQQYSKANGMFFYQYVQSFSPDEKITPQKAHEIGCQFAEYFKGHEVLIATHTDAAHIHTHFIINSVSHENGKKLQMARGSIHDLRKFSDEICKQHNLSIIQPKQKSGLRSREYRAAVKGESWKFKLMNAIDKAMDNSQSKQEFIKRMEQIGYGVKWIDHHKYITYTTPDGQKCRDNKLHDDMYLKERMERYYETEHKRSIKRSEKKESTKNSINTKTGTAGTAAAGRFLGAGGIYDERTKSHDSALWITPEDGRQSGIDANRNMQTSSTHAGKDIGTTDMGRLVKRDSAGSQYGNGEYGSSGGKLRKQPDKEFSSPNGQFENRTERNTIEQTGSIGNHLTGTGHDNDQTSVEVDRDWGGVASAVIGAAVALENLLVNEQEEDDKKKYVPTAEKRHKQKKKQSITHSRDDWEMEL